MTNPKYLCQACGSEVARSERDAHILTIAHRVATLRLYGAPQSEIDAVLMEHPLK